MESSRLAAPPVALSGCGGQRSEEGKARLPRESAASCRGRAPLARRRCAGSNSRGESCRGIVPSERTYCLVHDPEAADRVRAARQRGAVTAAKVHSLSGRRRKLDTAASVVKFLAGLAQDVAEEKTDPKVAGVVVYALSVQLKAIEMAESSEVRRLLAEVDRLTRAAQMRRPV
jgi:hypothetical protein